MKITDEMVSRFLGWRLPKNFAPDAGISFTPSKTHPDTGWPIGTNLFTADQARAMLEHVLSGDVSETGDMQWRPIDSAPQDGTIILLLVPTTWGKWNKAIPLPGRWEERDPPTSGFWITFNHDEALARVEATHWMPLPEAPK